MPHLIKEHNYLHEQTMSNKKIPSNNTQWLDMRDMLNYKTASFEKFIKIKFLMESLNFYQKFRLFFKKYFQLNAQVKEKKVVKWLSHYTQLHLDFLRFSFSLVMLSSMSRNFSPNISTFHSVHRFYSPIHGNSSTN